MKRRLHHSQPTGTNKTLAKALPQRPTVYLLDKKRMEAVLNTVGAPSASDGSTSTRWDAALGCLTSEASLDLLLQVIKLRHLPTDASETTIGDALATAVAQLAELKPRTLLEGMLAAHMVGTQELAMTFMARATLPAQTTEGTDLNVNRSARLMRIFLEQVEAYARLKGLVPQQRVVVERVDVQPGGQAVVSAVSTTLALSSAVAEPVLSPGVGVGVPRRNGR